MDSLASKQMKLWMLAYFGTVKNCLSGVSSLHSSLSSFKALIMTSV